MYYQPPTNGSLTFSPTPEEAERRLRNYLKTTWNRPAAEASAICRYNSRRWKTSRHEWLCYLYPNMLKGHDLLERMAKELPDLSLDQRQAL